MKYTKTTLKSGVRLIVVPKKETPSVTAMILVETGSNYEKKSENGLSHFLEHMMFKGTAKRPSSSIIAHELDSLGAYNNAFTSNEFTGYFVKAEHKHFEHIFEILSDLYLNPKLPVADLEKERGVILQEISMYEDSPQAKVANVFDGLMYGDTPAGRTILGSVKNIKKFKRSDFERYRRAHYVAQKTIIVIAGNVEPNRVKKLSEKYFENIPQGPRIGKQKIRVIQKNPRLAVFQKKTDQTHLILGFNTFPANDRRWPLLSLLSAILGQGMSSRLFQKMREELGICYYVKSSSEGFTDHGNLKVRSGVDASRVEVAIGAIVNELKKLKVERVSEKELSKAKDYVVGNFYMGLETSDNWAEFYLDQEITNNGKIDTPKDIENKIRSVRAEDIQKLAKEIFRSNNANLAFVGNIKNQSRLKKLLVL